MSKLLGAQAVEGNPLQKIAQLEQRMAGAENGEVNAATLSDISEDLGAVRAGMFIAGDGEFPPDSSNNFSGMVMIGESFEWPASSGNYWNLLGFESGVLMVGVSATTGKLLAAGGAVVIDNLGITRTGVKFFDRWDATNAGISRRREIGSFLPTGSTTPAGYDWFGDPTENTNLQTNGDFEAGDLSSFDAADSTTPTWAADDGSPYDGTYAALLTTTDDADGSELHTVNPGFEAGDLSGWTTGGTGAWANSTDTAHSGTKSAKLTVVAQTGTLTTNLGGTPRYSVTAGLYYRAELWMLAGGVTLSIKWYTATSGGSLISTDSVSLTDASGSWGHRAQTAVAPATALGAEISISIASTTAVMYFDDFSFKAAQYGTLTTNLGATPRMAVTAGNSYQFSVYAKTDTSGSGVWDTVKAEINWYTATSGGSLVSTSTIPISLGTSYANTAIPLTAPATSAGATIVITAVRDSTASYDSTVLAYFDDISFRVLTVSRYIKWLPNVTIEGGPLDLTELGAAPSTPAAGYTSDYADTNDERRFLNDKGQDNQYSFGQRGTAVSLTLTTGEQAIVSKTVKANTMGTKGWIESTAKLIYHNNSGAARTFTVTYNFGSYAATYAVSLNNHATSRHPFWITVRTFNNQASNAQGHMIEFGGLPGSVIAAATVQAQTLFGEWDTSAVDTTADITVSITIKVNNATVTQTAIGVGNVDGPYYGA